MIVSGSESRHSCVSVKASKIKITGIHNVFLTLLRPPLFHIPIAKLTASDMKVVLTVDVVDVLVHHLSYKTKWLTSDQRDLLP